MVAAQDGYTGDRFYASTDGHYVGDDGFVVPKDFTEFYARFPHHIHNWAKKRMYGGSEDEVEDWSHDLLIHLQSLPKESKHREDGKTDVIQTFDPFRQYGASQRRFLSYINFCLMNKFRTVGSKFSRNPLSRADNISLSGNEADEAKMGHDRMDSTEEFVYQHSTQLSKASEKGFKTQDDRMFTGEFLEFVYKKEPEVAPLLHAVWEAGGSFADTRRFWCVTCKRLSNLLEVQSGAHTGHQLGIEQRQFNRFRGRLKELAGKFVREV